MKKAEVLAWIAQQQKEMQELLIQWSEINSGSFHVEGLARMLRALEERFSPLKGTVRHHTLSPKEVVDAQGEVQFLPLGQALSFTKRSDAPLRVLFSGHMDTVFPKESPFQKVKWLDETTVKGPGVADLKGGLVILLYSLLAFEQFDAADSLGWEILINPDEEIGSTGSEPLLREAAQRCHVGLVFEPCLQNGALVGARKGSLNFVLVARGRSAHVGRAFSDGRHAIYALAEAIEALEKCNDGDTIVNVGSIEGGGPTNVVPDLAIARVNARVTSEDTLQHFLGKLNDILAQVNQRDGIAITQHAYFARPPKTLDAGTKNLFNALQSCAHNLGQEELRLQETGGVCDGNILASAGLPNIDTLGMKGGGLHTHDEYAFVSSLVERTQLVSSYLMGLATGEFSP